MQSGNTCRGLPFTIAFSNEKQNVLKGHRTSPKKNFKSEPVVFVSETQPALRLNVFVNYVSPTFRRIAGKK
jgi:hypothetical protein